MPMRKLTGGPPPVIRLLSPPVTGGPVRLFLLVVAANGQASRMPVIPVIYRFLSGINRPPDRGRRPPVRRETLWCWSGSLSYY